MKPAHGTRGALAHTLAVERVVAQHRQHSCRAFVWEGEVEGAVTWQRVIYMKEWEIRL